MSEDDFDDAFDEEGGEEGPVPLDRNEAARVRRDLDDLTAFRHTFEPEGFKGVSLFCHDCVEEHFYGWQMLEHNLRALLESGETPVHEPAFDPHPDDYIDWEYAQGYLDGLADAGAPVLPPVIDESEGCPFCGTSLPASEKTVVHCPTCGTHLGPARIARALLDRGWSNDDVADLLRRARVPPMRGLPGSDGQDTTSSGSQDTTSSGSQDTTGTGSQDTTGTGSQDTTGTGSQDTTGTGSQDTTGTGSQDTGGSGSQDTGGHADRQEARDVDGRAHEDPDGPR